MKHPDNMDAVAGLQPNYLGFIFYAKSPRFMEETLLPNTVQEISTSIEKVGVFVNESADVVIKKTAEYGISILQLHGDESPEYCLKMKKHGYQVIKAKTPLAELDRYTSALRSMTQGRASFTQKFAEYAPVPDNIQADLVKGNLQSEEVEA